MGVGVSASQTNSSSQNKENESINKKSNSSGATSNNFQQAGNASTDATFNSPQGKSILDALTGLITGKGQGQGAGYQQQAADAFTKATNSSPNPEVNNIIQSNNAEADRTFANRLAKTRSQNYRGGISSNLYGQGTLARDFTNDQAGQNANLRYGAFNDAQNRSLTGASGLAGIGANQASQQQGLGAQILALLRGQSTSTGQTGQSAGTSNETSVEDVIRALTGSASGKSSTIGANASFSV